jgi:hypothetical protein
MRLVECGIVYQKDLGPRTRELAMAMRAFDPDQTWTKAETSEIPATNPVKP